MSRTPVFFVPPGFPTFIFSAIFPFVFGEDFLVVREAFGRAIFAAVFLAALVLGGAAFFFTVFASIFGGFAGAFFAEAFFAAGAGPAGNFSLTFSDFLGVFIERADFFSSFLGDFIEGFPAGFFLFSVEAPEARLFLRSAFLADAFFDGTTAFPFLFVFMLSRRLFYQIRQG